jgi:acyl dehydratase
MELKTGAVAIVRRSYTQDDFDRFATLSGDDNPIHVDPEFAARTRFGRTVCHGMLLFSTVCAALTREIGPGFVQLEQELMFVSPTYTGEEVAIRLEITSVAPELGQAEISTVITRPDGSIACQGQARVLLPGAPAPAAQHGPAVGNAMAAPGHPATAAAYKGLCVGQVAQDRRTFTGADIAEYVALSGDANPAYLGCDSAQVPGGLLGGLFSYLLGTRLPGRGTNWLKQKLVFPAPAAAGDAVEARVEIVRLRPEKDLINLATTCALPDGRIVCHGEALVLVKDLESA